MMLVYPSADGQIGTLESEAVRCGINDLRYLVTLDNALRRLTDQDPVRAGEIRKRLDALLDKYGFTGSQYWGRMIYGTLNWPEHQATVPNRQFDTDRGEVVKLIQECRKAAG